MSKFKVFGPFNFSSSWFPPSPKRFPSLISICLEYVDEGQTLARGTVRGRIDLPSPAVFYKIWSDHTFSYPTRLLHTIPNQTKTYCWTIFLDVFVIQKLCSNSFGTSQSCRIYFLRYECHTSSETTSKKVIFFNKLFPSTLFFFIFTFCLKSKDPIKCTNH